MLPQHAHKCSHIARKRGVYHYRRRLPLPWGGEVSISLRTRDFREAQWLAHRLDLLFPKMIRHMTDKPDIQTIIREYLRRALEDDMGYRLARPGLPLFGLDAADPVASDLEFVEAELQQSQREFTARRFDAQAPLIDELQATHNVPDELRNALAFGILGARVEMWRTIRKRTLGEFESFAGGAPQAASVAAETETGATQGPKLSEVLPAFLDQMTRDEGWRGQTLAQNSTTYRMFQEVCGDRPPQAYQRKDLTVFYDTLRGLPALYSKSRQWRGKALAEIVASTTGQEIERITMKTLKRHFSALGRLFTYLKKRGQYEGENPAHGFEFPMKGRKGPGRVMWEGEELRKLFTSPVWTGCLSESRRYTPGTRIIKDEKYWLPILGLYHGNRLEEFAQLLRSDIRQEEGVWYFDINDEEAKQLKNEQSRRRVPIHPKALSLGFMEYVEGAAPSPSDRVFPALAPSGKDKRYGATFTQWFTRYRKEIGVYRRGLDYHSFRHGVTTKLYAAGVEEYLIDELTGHEGGGISRSVYKAKGKTPIRGLYEAISKIQWDEVAFQ